MEYHGILKCKIEQGLKKLCSVLLPILSATIINQVTTSDIFTWY